MCKKEARALNRKNTLQVLNHKRIGLHKIVAKTCAKQNGELTVRYFRK
jgi:hypothetical protein